MGYRSIIVILSSDSEPTGITRLILSRSNVPRESAIPETPAIAANESATSQVYGAAFGVDSDAPCQRTAGQPSACRRCESNCELGAHGWTQTLGRVSRSNAKGPDPAGTATIRAAVAATTPAAAATARAAITECAAAVTAPELPDYHSSVIPSPAPKTSFFGV